VSKEKTKTLQLPVQERCLLGIEIQIALDGNHSNHDPKLSSDTDKIGLTLLFDCV
jgi:hypothetical protein